MEVPAKKLDFDQAKSKNYVFNNENIIVDKIDKSTPRLLVDSEAPQTSTAYF